jgi:hypothetical protein
LTAAGFSCFNDLEAAIEMFDKGSATFHPVAIIQIVYPPIVRLSAYGCGRKLRLAAGAWASRTTARTGNELTAFLTLCFIWARATIAEAASGAGRSPARSNPSIARGSRQAATNEVDHVVKLVAMENRAEARHFTDLRASQRRGQSGTVKSRNSRRDFRNENDLLPFRALRRISGSRHCATGPVPLLAQGPAIDHVAGEIEPLLSVSRRKSSKAAAGAAVPRWTSDMKIAGSGVWLKHLPS